MTGILYQFFPLLQCLFLSVVLLLHPSTGLSPVECSNPDSPKGALSSCDVPVPNTDRPSTDIGPRVTLSVDRPLTNTPFICYDTLQYYPVCTYDQVV